MTTTHPAPHASGRPGAPGHPGAPGQAAAPGHPAAAEAAISAHAGGDDAALRRGFGPRVRRLHARIGAAHRQAEGMVFSRALLEGQVSPFQLAALLCALRPAYELLEEQGPELAAALGSTAIPWAALARSQALAQDAEALAALPAAPASAAAALWLEQLRVLAQQAPHRLMAHIYVRYGGDLSGGQQLGGQANAILQSYGLPALHFWAFNRPTPELKQALHDGFEQLDLSPAEEEELLEEAESAFRATQRLLAELAELAPA
ncbi:biliverdin-producing heme oxygenase [Vulcanococcus limneticus]|uniref:biliverdin-producing heme oxygenase n=1 Tax=Vulcanococcus limneticus TaxID=2170428 RepID=UPI00398BEBB9